MERLNIALSSLIFGCSLGVTGDDNTHLMLVIFLAAGTMAFYNVIKNIDFTKYKDEEYEEWDDEECKKK